MSNEYQIATVYKNTNAGFVADATIFPVNTLLFETDTKRFRAADGSTAAGSLPYVGGGGVTVVKTATETKTANTTLAADAVLQFAAAASTKYRIKLRVFFDTVAAADFKFQISGPATPTLYRSVRKHVDPTNLTTLVSTSEVAYTTSTAINAGTGTTGGYIELDAILHNSTTAGVFSFDWAQNASDAGATSVLAGSTIEYTII